MQIPSAENGAHWAYGLMVASISSVWATVDPSTLIPLLCALIGVSVPISTNLLHWTRERRAERRIVEKLAEEKRVSEARLLLLNKNGIPDAISH